MLYENHYKELTKEEKVLVLDLLLQDFCANYSFSDTQKRYPLTVRLCEELVIEYPVLSEIQKRVLDFPQADFYGDGYFHGDYTKGGYENLEDIHKLSPTFLDKSHNFKTIASEYVTWDALFNDLVEEEQISEFDYYNSRYNGQ